MVEARVFDKDQPIESHEGTIVQGKLSIYAERQSKLKENMKFHIGNMPANSTVNIVIQLIMSMKILNGAY